MLRLLRFVLPALWLLALFSGVGGTLSSVLLIGAAAAWLVPWLQASKRTRVAPAPTKPGSDPLLSSFETAPSPDALWTHFTVYPAKGKGPSASLMTIFAIVGGAAAGAMLGFLMLGSGGDIWGFIVAGPVLSYLINKALHQYMLGPFHLSGYRKVVQAPNLFDVGPAGLRVAGEVIPRASLLRYTSLNPFTNAIHHAPASSPFVAGTGTLGVAAAVGASVGNSFAQAGAIQRAHLLARLASHGWILEVIDTRGNAHRLAGGLTENTADALVHAIETHLGV